MEASLACLILAGVAVSAPAQAAGVAPGLRDFLRQRCGLPRERGPLNARLTGRLVGEGFTLEKLVYDAEPGSSVPAHLYLPVGSTGPVPALVMSCGHGGSKSAFFNQYAGQLYAKAGIAVLIPDPIGEEERHAQGLMGTRAHDGAARQAQDLGRPVVGKMVWDLMRGIDYLQTRREIDPGRIGTAGHSLGAIVSAYLAAADERVRLAILAAMYFDPAEGGKHCTMGLYHLVRERIDYPTLIGMAAPRCATLMVVGDDDPICQGRRVYEEGFRRTFAEASKRYEVGGAPERLGRQVYPDAGHRPYFLTREAMLWVEGHFGLPRLTPVQIGVLPTIRMGEWAERSGVAFEKLYGTEQHYAGLDVPEVGVRYFPPAELACLAPGECARPEFTVEGWLAKVGGPR